MKGLPPFLVALGILVSGCSGDGGGKGPDEEPFAGLEGSATETTGVLRGVVVDDRIVPIAGAIIDLRGATERPNQTTDEQGRFLFSDLDPGIYFLHVTSALHQPTQSNAEVVAGEDEPDIVRVQLERLFTQDPFPVQVVREGFFQCSQAGASPHYSSSTCIDGIAGEEGSEAYPPISNTTSQDREWHTDVGPGWQAIVFELDWDQTSDSTSERMGLVVSTYKPERDPAHQFANFVSAAPLWGRIDVGVEHDTAGNEEPTMIPPEGMTDMSFFVSVRPPEGAICPYTCVPPGISYNQQFKVYVTMFHYGLPPNDDWSFVRGDPLPF